MRKRTDRLHGRKRPFRHWGESTEGDTLGTMERARWTDERLDSGMHKIDRNFDRVFDELRAERQAMRGELTAERDALRSDMARMREEFRADMAGTRDELRSDMAGMRVELRPTSRGSRPRWPGCP